MAPIRTIFEIRFKSAPRQFNMLGTIMRAIGSDTPTTPPQPIDQNFRIVQSDKKTGIFVAPLQLAINIEDGSEPPQAKTRLLQLSEQITGVLSWGPMVRIGLRNQIVLPVGDFEQLVRRCKERLYTNNDLLSHSVDVALPLTLVEGDLRVNFIFGPMRDEELRQRQFEFQTEFPPACGFVDVDSFRVLDRTFSTSFVKEFLTRGFACTEKQTMLIAKILEI
jgi:hypothetical protein